MSKGLGIAISGFVLLVVALVLITSIADNISKMSALNTVTNDLFTASNTSCVQVTTGCIDSLTSIENTTSTLGVANYSLCRSTSNLDGIILKDPSVHNANVMNATYIYSADCTYVADSTSRTLVGLIVLFFAIAILAIGYWIIRNSEMFDL